jgi:hypothetical protein
MWCKLNTWDSELKLWRKLENWMWLGVFSLQTNLINHIESLLIIRRVKADFPKNLYVNGTDCSLRFPKLVCYCFADARIVRKCRHVGGLCTVSAARLEPCAWWTLSGNFQYWGYASGIVENLREGETENLLQTYWTFSKTWTAFWVHPWNTSVVAWIWNLLYYAKLKNLIY